MSRIMLVGSFAIFLELTVPGLAANDPNTPPCPKASVQNLVCVTTSYDPASSSYSPPNCTPTNNYDNEVGNAYDSAPWKVKQELCKLKNIIIQTDQDAYSWGYWENPQTKSTSGSRPNTYIGIRSDNTNSTLQTVLDDNFASVFENTTPNGLNPQHIVTSDSVVLGLLAVLAHEIGHIKWHRDNIYSSLSCYYGDFVGANKSWNADQRLARSVARNWHPGFSDPDAGGSTSGSQPSRASHAVAGAPDPHARNLAPGQVRNLYTMGFVSAPAGISPEEDFVETYALLTVLNVRVGTPPTISLRITNGATVSIPDDSSLSKRNCIDPALINFP